MSEDAVSDDLRPLIEILRKETGGRHFDPGVLRSRLDDLMAAAGLSAPRPAMSVEQFDRRSGSEAAGDRGPGALEKALHYARILERPDPLGEGPIHSIYRREIDALARGRAPAGFDGPDGGPPPGGDAPASLTDRLGRDLALLRQVVEELRTHNELMGRPDAPNREGRQVLILWLADLYVELTGKGGGPFELPHGEGSRFIRFCHFALAPHLPRRETRTAVLSRAWKRLKAARRASPG